MICIYHKMDLDGIGCAALAYRYYRKQFEDSHFGLFGYEYGEKMTFLGNVKKDEMVIICDINIGAEMTKLLEITKNVIWIDHHPTPELDALYSGLNISGIRDTNQTIKRSAIELTWNYLFPSERMPEGVWLISQWDVWNHTNRDVKPYYSGIEWILSGYPINRRHSVLLDLLLDEEKTKEAVSIGMTIEAYKTSQLYPSYRENMFEGTFEGYSAVCVNMPSFNSDVFPREMQNKYDLLIGFHHTDADTIKVSLRTVKDNVNCTMLANMHGGGGHPKASGFRLKNKPLTDVITKKQ